MQISNSLSSSHSRYHRQTAFESFGASGQERLGRSRILICGCGALGSMVATLLCRAGAGGLRLVDPDVVQRDNLHRQILFDEKDATQEKPKVDAAADKLRAANSEVSIESIRVRLTASNADELVAGQDLLIDGTDNFRTRFLLNRTAIRQGIPLVSAGVLAASGQILSIIPGQTPCLACVLTGGIEQNNKDDQAVEQPNSLLDESGLEEHGILAPSVTLAASLQAMESLKILSGNWAAVNKTLLSFDLWNNRFHFFPVHSMENRVSEFCCQVCGREL